MSWFEVMLCAMTSFADTICKLGRCKWWTDRN